MASFIGTFFGMGEDSQTIRQVMLEDIEFIYKCKNAIIFDNSIGIREKKKSKKLIHHRKSKSDGAFVKSKI